MYIEKAGVVNELLDRNGAAAAMDLSAFQKQVVRSGTQQRVEVNQRHLIDKILARYSAKFTVFRELLQNSNDAGATSAQIRFTTLPQKFGLPFRKQQVKNVQYRNNGRCFSSEDWTRLRRIAEGNPDETKIGFFGVGYYSVFSLCAEPCVFSGDTCLAFTWDGDQLLTSRQDVPQQLQEEFALSGEDVLIVNDEVVSRSWTVFNLDVMDPAKETLPDLDEFTKFLTNSLAFTANLASVSVYFDDKLVCKVHKLQAVIGPLKAPKQIAGTSLPEKMFSLRDGEISQVQLSVTQYNDKGKPSKSGKCMLKLFAANVGVSVPRDLAKEIERITKKRPPSKAKIQCIMLNYDEYETVKAGGGEMGHIFSEIVPFPSQGRIYIGFPTHQMTGCAVHIAAPVIPTVERETIDFVDNALMAYNSELLSMCGVILRVCYEYEMSQLGVQWDRIFSQRNSYNPVRDELFRGDVSKTREYQGFDMMMARWRHLANIFLYRPTTPLGKVGQLLYQSFFKCTFASRMPPSILSTHGVLSADKVLLCLPEAESTGVQRDMYIDEMEAYLEQKPLLPAMCCKDMFDKSILSSISALLKGTAHEDQQALPFPVLIRKFYSSEIRTCTLADLAAEFSRRTISTTKEFVSLVRWWSKFVKARRLRDHDSLALWNWFASSVVLTLDSDTTASEMVADGGEVWKPPTDPVQLSMREYYINPSRLPVDDRYLPVLSNALPLCASTALHSQDMQHIGIREVNVLGWCEYHMKNTYPALLKEEQKSSQGNSLDWSKFWDPMLGSISKYWSSERNSASRIKDLFKGKACVRIQDGTYAIPDDVYFPSVNIFEDLKHCTYPKEAGVSHAVLECIGVRDRIDLQTIFSRMHDLNWNSENLIGYLAKTNLTADEKRRLSVTPFVKATVTDPTTGATSVSSMKPKDIVCPTDEHRALGVPVLNWGSHFRSNSPEGKFLLAMGLREYVTIKELYGACPKAITDSASRAKLNCVLAYLIKNIERFRTSYSDNQLAARWNFIPCHVSGADGTKAAVQLSAPTKCFSNESCGQLGFPVVDAKVLAVHDRHVLAGLGVRNVPNGQELFQYIVEHPPRTLEEATKQFPLYSSLGTLQQHEYNQLRSAPFIPIAIRGGGVRYEQPENVYFTSAESKNLYGDIFTTVDFGPDSRQFLHLCGVKDRPSPAELAATMCTDPLGFLQRVGMNRYKGLLLFLSTRWEELEYNKALVQRMRDAPFLLYVVKPKGVFVGVDESDDAFDSSEDASMSSAQDEPSSKKKYMLGVARDISLLDFGERATPFELKLIPDSQLTKFYKRLGSKWLSEELKTSTVLNAQTAFFNKKSAQYMKLIRHRAPLIIYKQGDVVRDALKKLKSMTVLEVSDIVQRTQFRGQNAEGKVSCVHLDKLDKRIDVNLDQSLIFRCEQQGMKDLSKEKFRANVMLMTRELRLQTAASMLAAVILKRADPPQIASINTVLSSDIPTLRMLSYPVEKIMQESQQKELNLDEDGIVLPLSNKIPEIVEQAKQVFFRVPPEEVEAIVREQHKRIVQTMASTELSETDAVRQLKGLVSQQGTLLQTRKAADAVVKRVQAILPGVAEGDIREYIESNAALAKMSDEELDEYARDVANSLMEDTPELEQRSQEAREVRAAAAAKESKKGISDYIGRFTSMFKKDSNADTGVQAAGHSGNGGGNRIPDEGELKADTSGEDRGPGRPHVPQKELQNSIKNCKQFASNSLYTPDRLDPPRITTCDPVSGQHLKQVLVWDGMRVFVSERYPHPDNEALARQSGGIMKELAEFARLIRRLISVFDIDRNSVYVYYENGGKVIAFNTNGSLFFNLSVYRTLKETYFDSMSSRMPLYWYTVMCHELAHNVTHAHDQTHEFYMESYIVEYMERFSREFRS